MLTLFDEHETTGRLRPRWGMLALSAGIHLAALAGLIVGAGPLTLGDGSGLPVNVVFVNGPVQETAAEPEQAPRPIAWPRSFAELLAEDGAGRAVEAGGSGAPRGGDVVMPRIIESTWQLPEYPVDAMLDRIQGDVLIEATIDREGEVHDVRVVHGLRDDLDAAAVAAVSKWRFRPGTLAGRPVEVRYRLTVEFRL